MDSVLSVHDIQAVSWLSRCLSMPGDEFSLSSHLLMIPTEQRCTEAHHSARGTSQRAQQGEEREAISWERTGCVSMLHDCFMT